MKNKNGFVEDDIERVMAIREAVGRRIELRFDANQGYSETAALRFVEKVRLARPKELPDHVGRILVTRLNLDPDWVWKLKCAMHPIADEKNVFRIRILNPETAAGQSVAVANYNSLDDHPDMILFSA